MAEQSSGKGLEAYEARGCVHDAAWADRVTRRASRPGGRLWSAIDDEVRQAIARIERRRPARPVGQGFDEVPLPSFVRDLSELLGDPAAFDRACARVGGDRDWFTAAERRKVEIEGLRQEIAALLGLVGAFDPSLPACLECGKPNEGLDPVCIWCRTRIE